VTGRTRRDVFGADFVFVADSVEDWIGNQGKQSNTPANTLHASVPAHPSMSPSLEPPPIGLGIVSRRSRREHTIRRASWIGPGLHDLRNMGFSLATFRILIYTIRASSRLRMALGRALRARLPHSAAPGTQRWSSVV